jgi:phosphate transport system permease protein
MNKPETIPSPAAASEQAGSQNSGEAATQAASATMMKTLVAQQGGAVQATTHSAPPSVVRTFLQAKSSGKLADGAFASLMVICALAIFAIVVMILFVLIANSRLSMHAFGWKFFTSQTWDPVSGEFGALPFIFGTVLSSLLAVVMAVPLALAVSIFLLDICPKMLQGPISF